mgnify:CR=1 FL=1
MSKQELLKPTNDYVFGRIFGYQGNEFITQGLLEAITEDKYQVLIADFNLKNLLKIPLLKMIIHLELNYLLLILKMY